MSAMSAYTIRRATAHDDRALVLLAALDSKAPIAQPALLAEVDGEAVAVLSLVDGRAAADPFRPTAPIVDHLRMRAAALTAGAPSSRRSLRRRLGGALRPVPQPGAPAMA